MTFKAFLQRVFIAIFAIVLVACSSGDSDKTMDVTARNSPTITVLGEDPVSIERGGTYTDLGATALGSLGQTLEVTASGEVDTSVAGTYVLTYTTTDSDGNTSTATRTINVIDTTPPVITLSGGETISIDQFSTYAELGATAKDGETEVDVVVAGNVDISTPGVYTITYTATDAAGNSTNTSRVVTVVDKVPPVITVLGDNPAAIQQGEVYSDSGATAEDSHDGMVPVSQSGTVDGNLVGEYTITYTASDEVGNLATVTRTVNVTLPPDNHLKVTLKASSKIAGYEIHLQFTDDTSFLNEATLNNSFLRTTGRTATDLGPGIDNDLKTIKFGAFSFGNQDGVAGAFDVFTFTTKDRKDEVRTSSQSCVGKDAQNIDCIVTIEEQ